jgi:hypothetical protein
MVACGSAALYCPAGSASVKAVASGYYSTPVDVEETARAGELECETGFACVGGIKTSCAEGFFSNAGATSCESCGPGFYMHESVNLTKSCLECVAGKYSKTGASSIEGCEDCALGFVSREPGMGYCDPCTPGKHASQDNAACTACEAGTYSGVAAFECDACEAGKYVLAHSLLGKLCLANSTQVRWLKQLRHMRDLCGQQGHQRHRGQLGVQV